MPRYCPECGEELKTDAKFCKKCGYNIEEATKPQAQQSPQPLMNAHPNYVPPPMLPKKHSAAGIASLVLGIISMCLIWTSFVWFLYLFVELPMSIIATSLGGVAYWGKAKDKFGLAGFILGLLVIIIGLVFALIPIMLSGRLY